MIFRGFRHRLVVTCISTSRTTKPVVDEPKLWKTPAEVITGGAAAQREKAGDPKSAGEPQSSQRPTGARSKLTWRLTMLAALGSPAFTLTIAAYVQSRPNMAAVTVSGPFNGERAFADLKHLVSFGPRPSGSAALERTRQYIIGELHGAVVAVTQDKFTASTPIGALAWTHLGGIVPLGLGNGGESSTDFSPAHR